MKPRVFSEGEIAPLNRTGDEQGCTFSNGAVTTPDGFAQAYRKYIEGGWASLSGDPEYGGQGLPDSVSIFIEDLMSSANMAWTMYPGLSPRGHRSPAKPWQHRTSEKLPHPPAQR